MLKVTAAILFYTISLVLCAKVATEKENSMTMPRDSMTMPRDLMTSGSDGDGSMGTEKASAMMPDLMAIMNDCNDTFRIEMSYLESMRDSGSFSDETDKTPKCFVNCVLEMTEVASDNGQFDADMAAQIFSMPGQMQQMKNIQAMATTCNHQRMESDKCISSYMFMKCLMESDVRTFMKIM